MDLGDSHQYNKVTLVGATLTILWMEENRIQFEN